MLAAIMAGESEARSDGTHYVNRTCSQCQGRPAEPGATACEKCRGKGFVVEVFDLASAGHWLSTFQRLFMLAKCGVLPDAGGSLDQAATFLDAFAIVESELAALQQARMSKV